MSEKSDRISVMQRTLDWASEIELIAGSMLSSDTRESWLARAARKSGASFRQIKALYYGEAKDPRFSVASKIISAADQARIAEAKRDAQVVAKFFNMRAQALANVDPDIHRTEIDVFVEAARLVSSGNSA